MKQGPSKVDGANAAPRDIVVGDILRCLSALADMQRDARTGNVAFADAIRIFADALKPHRSRPVQDLIELLAGLGARNAGARRKENACRAALRLDDASGVSCRARARR